MTLKPEDHADVKNIVTALEVQPHRRVEIIRMLVAKIHKLEKENRALLDEVLNGGRDEF